MSSVGLVWFLCVLGLATVLVRLIWYHPRRDPRHGEPLCGRCGYIVRGLPTATCPECGSDLGDVGIVYAKKPVPPLKGRVKILAWSALMLLFSLGGSTVATMLFGHWATVGPRITVSVSAGAIGPGDDNPSAASSRTQPMPSRTRRLAPPDWYDPRTGYVLGFFVWLAGLWLLLQRNRSLPSERASSEWAHPPAR